MRSILVICFNRPEFTRQIFQDIRAAAPEFLYVAIDGARAGQSGESEAVQEVRDVFEHITWPSHVIRDYSPVHMGCQNRIVSAYEGTFAEVESATILEDDVIVRPDFFNYCDMLLDRYKDADQVTAISGCSHVRSSRFIRSSYYFSRYPEMWGWAAFRRTMTDVNWAPDPDEIAHRLKSFLRRPDEPQRWAELLHMVKSNELDTWDYQLIVDSILRSRVAVIPRVPLSRNRGFGAGSTHTSAKEPLFARPIAALETTLRHPASIKRSALLDVLRSVGTLPPRNKAYAKARPYAQEIRRRMFHEGDDRLGTT
jgi:hypothetical protein